MDTVKTNKESKLRNAHNGARKGDTMARLHKRNWQEW